MSDFDQMKEVCFSQGTVAKFYMRSKQIYNLLIVKILFILCTKNY